MSISEEFLRVYNEYMNDSTKSIDTKSLIMGCYHNVIKHLRIFDMVSKYPDLHMRMSKFICDADGILISKEVNHDSDIYTSLYYAPLGKDELEAILYVFKKDNGMTIFADPSFVSLGIISDNEFHINNKLNEIISGDLFCKEVYDSINYNVYKIMNGMAMGS